MVLVQHQRIESNDYLIVYLDRMQPSLNPCPGPTEDYFTSCSPIGVPGRLYAHLRNVGSCTCLDGLTIPLQYGPLNPPNVNGVITNVTTGTPQIVTSAKHRLQTGWMILIQGVEGAVQANWWQTVTVIDADSFSINSEGNANMPYTGGGTWTLLGVWSGSASGGCDVPQINAILTPCVINHPPAWLWTCWAGTVGQPDVRAQSVLFQPSYGPPFSAALASPLIGPFTAYNQPAQPTVSACTGLPALSYYTGTIGVQ